MKLSELSLQDACSVFYRAQNSEISYSWFGNPEVSIKVDGNRYSESLSSLEDKAKEILRSRNELQNPEAHIETAYFAKQVCLLLDKSQTEIENANFISRIFYKIQRSLAEIFSYVSFYLNDDLHLFQHCYVSISADLALINGFQLRFPPERRDSMTNDALYNHEQIAQIYPQLQRV